MHSSFITSIEMLLQLLFIGLLVNSFYFCSDGKMDVISELVALQWVPLLLFSSFIITKFILDLSKM